MRLPAIYFRSTCRSVGALALTIAWAVSQPEIGFLKLLQAAEPLAVVSNDDLTSLTLQLGDADFSARQSAQAKLLAAGAQAITALETATSHKDPEIRLRAARLLDAIQYELLQKKLDAFCAAERGTAEPAFPAWERFQTDFGDNRGIRTFFAKLQQTYPECLAALAHKTPELTDHFRRSQKQLLAQIGANETPEIPLVALLILVGGNPDVRLTEADQFFVIHAANQTSWNDLLASEELSPFARKALGKALVRCEGKSVLAALNIAWRYQLPEMVIPARRILHLSRAGGIAPTLSQQALLAVAQFGTTADIPLLETFLETTQVLSASTNADDKRYEMQIRDLALAATLWLSKQNLNDYYPLPEDQPVGHPPDFKKFDPQFFQAQRIGFASPERRAAVFAKWEAKKAEIPPM